MEPLPPIDDLFLQQSTVPYAHKKRPGCITLYVVIGSLIWASLCMYIVVMVIMELAGHAAEVIRSEYIYSLLFRTTIIVGFTPAIFVYLRGLWRLRSEAYFAARTMHALVWFGWIAIIIGDIPYSLQRMSRPIMLFTVIGLLITFYPIYWFLTNRQRFD